MQLQKAVNLVKITTKILRVLFVYKRHSRDIFVSAPVTCCIFNEF